MPAHAPFFAPLLTNQPFLDPLLCVHPAPPTLAPQPQQGRAFFVGPALLASPASLVALTSGLSRLLSLEHDAAHSATRRKYRGSARLGGGSAGHQHRIGSVARVGFTSPGWV